MCDLFYVTQMRYPLQMFYCAELGAQGRNKFLFRQMRLTKWGMAGISNALRTDFMHFKKYFCGIKMAHFFSLCNHFQNAVSVTPADQGPSSILPKKVFRCICGRIKGLININKCCIVKKKSLHWYCAKYKISLYTFKEIANINGCVCLPTIFLMFLELLSLLVFLFSHWFTLKSWGLWMWCCFFLPYSVNIVFAFTRVLFSALFSLKKLTNNWGILLIPWVVFMISQLCFPSCNLFLPVLFMFFSKRPTNRKVDNAGNSETVHKVLTSA